MSTGTNRRGLLGLLLAALLYPAAAGAATCGSLPFTFVNGTTADGNQVNANFASLLTCVNTLLAPLLSPTLTGVPLTPTPAANTGSTQIVNEAWVGTFFQPITAPVTPLVSTAGTGVAGNYTALNSDDHKTLFLNTSGVGGATLTVNSLASYTDTSYSVAFCNIDSRRWTVTSADVGSVFLYPKQCNTLRPAGAVLIYSLPFQRYRSPNAVLYAAASGCTANNDGLVVGSPLCLVGEAAGGATLRFRTDFDLAGTNPSVQLADGTYTECINVNGGVGAGWQDGINILGHAGSPGNVVLVGQSGCSPFFGRDGSIAFITNVEMACASPVLPCVVSSQNTTVDLTNVTLGTSTSQTMLQMQAGGHIDLDGGMVVAGNGNAWVNAVGPASVFEATNQLISFSGSPAFSFVTIASGTGAQLDFTGATFAGAGVTGVRGTVANNAELVTGGHCTTATLGTTFSFLPGGANSAAVNGGICD